MPFRLLYHPAVRAEDIPEIPGRLRDRIARAIEARLTTEPASYGVPLRRNLKVYWKLRVGDYRVVFKIVDQEVWIFAVLHRSHVYESVPGRLSGLPER